ncbi:unnamed protein product, partial [Dovyalis caffra]
TPSQFLQRAVSFTEARKGNDDGIQGSCLHWTDWQKRTLHLIKILQENFPSQKNTTPAYD